MWWSCGWTHRRQPPRSDPLSFALPIDTKTIPGRKRNQLDVGISGVSKRSMRISFRLSGFSRGAFELLDHSYEVDKRFRVHLLDCPAALDLHGTLRSSKLVRNLFIEHARRDHGDQLLLARCQGVKAPLEDGYILILFTPGTISLQCDANSIQ